MWESLLRRLGMAPLPRYGRLLAAEVDFRHGATLLELNERLVAEVGRAGGAHSPSTPLLSPAEVSYIRAELLAKWSTRTLQELIPFANDSMTLQLSEMLQHLHDIDAGDSPVPVLPHPTLQLGGQSAASAPSIGPSTHTNPLPTLAFQAKAAHEESVKAAEASIRRQLQGRHGFALWLGPSQAPTGPHAAGVYLRGRAHPGAVVALFPGAVFSGEMLQSARDCGHLGDSRVPRALVPRLDETLLDTHAPTPTQRSNPYALGQHVRHPPPGVAPNVMRLQVDFVDGGEDGAAAAAAAAGGLLPFPPHLREYIPNVWGSDTTTGQGLYSALEQNIHLKGVVLVATRELWDEEVFVDHTLNPFAQAAGLIPPWAQEAWGARKELRRLSGRVSRETEAGVLNHFSGEVEEAKRLLAERTLEGGKAPPQRKLPLR